MAQDSQPTGAPNGRREARSAYPVRGINGHVVQTIGRRVASGFYEPGGTLNLDAIGEELGVSRTVVREALKVLTAKGMVDARPKRGTFIRPRDEWSLLDPDLLRWQFEGRRDGSFLAKLAEFRAIVEPAGARLAAVRRTDEDLRMLEDAVEEMRAANSDPDALTAADVRFHCALLASAHNEFLDQMQVVIETGLYARDALVYESAVWSDPLPVHAAVLDAVRLGDGDAAEAAVLALLDLSIRDVERMEPAAGTAELFIIEDGGGPAA
jgi:GntR family transcriptional regulator, galactonate operon transcriptional repressor